MFFFWQVDRDVPMYMMVAGDRAELRGLNLEGMRRLGFSDLEVELISQAVGDAVLVASIDLGMTWQK